MYWYEYRIHWWDELDSKTRVNIGFTIGKTYTEAMQNIVNMYGDDELINVELVYHDEWSCLDLTDFEKAGDFAIIKAVNVIVNKPIKDN